MFLDARLLLHSFPNLRKLSFWGCLTKPRRQRRPYSESSTRWESLEWLSGTVDEIHFLAPLCKVLLRSDGDQIEDFAAEPWRIQEILEGTHPSHVLYSVPLVALKNQLFDNTFAINSLQRIDFAIQMPSASNNRGIYITGLMRGICACVTGSSIMSLTVSFMWPVQAVENDELQWYFSARERVHAFVMELAQNLPSLREVQFSSYLNFSPSGLSTTYLSTLLKCQIVRENRLGNIAAAIVYF